MKLEKKLKSALIDYGAVNENWRIKIVAIEKIGRNSDFANVLVETYKPRSKKTRFSSYTAYKHGERVYLLGQKHSCKFKMK